MNTGVIAVYFQTVKQRAVSGQFSHSGICAPLFLGIVGAVQPPVKLSEGLSVLGRKRVI